MKTIKVALAAAGAVAVGWAFTASADIPASAYVQDGLIAQWDGIDNTGTGTHDSDAVTWVDRVGGRSPTQVNTKGGGGAWGGNCFIEGASASSCFWCEDDDLKSLIQSGELSVELYCSHTSTYTGYEDWLGFGKDGNSRWLKLDIRKSDSTAPVFQGLQYRTTGWNSSAKIANNTICAWGDAPQYAAIVCKKISGKYAATLYGNDTNKIHSVNYGTSAPSDGVLTFGGFGKAGNALLNARIYSVRIYNRALTPQEVVVNAALDKVRFDGADPQDPATWPEGVRYNAQKGTVEIAVAAGVEGAGGTVQVGDGTVSPYWAGFSEDVTLTPVPASGYVFYKWMSAMPLADDQVVPLTVKAGLANGIKAFFVPEGADVSESWVYLPLSTALISNVVTHATLKASVVSGTDLKVTAINALNGATTLKLNMPIFSQDGATLYSLVNIDCSLKSTVLTEVLFPDSVTTLKSSVLDFWSTVSVLRRVRLPQNLKTVPSYAFRSCTNLAELVDGFPPSITKVDASAFYGCSALTTAVDFAKIENFGKESFRGCSSLPVPDGCLVLSNAVIVGGNSFYAMTRIGRVDLTAATNLQSLCGFDGCTSLTNIVPLYPPSLTSLTSTQRNMPLQGEVKLSNPAFTSIPSGMWRGNKIGSVDMTGSGIDKDGIGLFALCTNSSISNITFSASFTSFPSGWSTSQPWLYDFSSASFKTVHWRGDPPDVPVTQGLNSLSYYAQRIPRWNAKWRALLDDPDGYEGISRGTQILEMNDTHIKEFRKDFPNDPFPVERINLCGQNSTTAWVTYWTPYPPTAKTVEPVKYFDALAYDRAVPVVSSGDETLFNGTYYVTNSTDKTVQGYCTAERWLAAAGKEATIEFPAAATLTRGLKLTHYTLHQLSGGDYANARAPTAWTLEGKVVGSDEWTTVDVRTSVEWESTIDPVTYPPTQKGLVPHRKKCFRTFTVAEEAQRCYSAFRFAPAASYQTLNAVSDATPCGLMELEFYGQVPSPDPVVDEFESSRLGFSDLAFSVRLKSLGEDTVRGVKATLAVGKIQISTNQDFTADVAESPETEVSTEAALTLTVSGLQPGTRYHARFVVTNDVEGAASETLGDPVETVSVPFILGEMRVSDDPNDASRKVVSMEVEQLYTSAATVKLYYGRETDPSTLVQTVDIAGAGTVVFDSYACVGGLEMFKVVVSTTYAGKDYASEVKKGTSDFFLADADENPTRFSNAANGIAFGVAAEGTELTLTRLEGLGEETVVDLRKAIYGPAGGTFKLVDVGTCLRQNVQMEELYLPDTVQELRPSALRGNVDASAGVSALRVVRLPAGLKKIPDSCFYGCAHLERLEPADWGAEVTNVAGSAFQECSRLVGDMRFPKVERFEAKCFYMTQITSIDVTGAPLTHVDGFGSCSSLTNFTPLLPPTVTYLGTMSGCKKLKQDLVFRGPTCTLAGGEHIRGAGFTSFDMSALKTVTMNGTLCFFDCGSMTNVVVAKGVTKLYGNSFMQSAGNLHHLTFLGGPASGLVTAYVGQPASYNMLITIPRECDEWMDYFATNTTYFASPTSAERKTFRKNFPGRRYPEYVVKLKQDNQSYFRFVDLDRTGLGLLIMVK